MVWYFIILPLLAGIPLFIFLFYKWKFSYWHKRGVPSSPASIPWGNFKGVGSTIHLKDLFDEIYYKFKTVTPIAGAYLFFGPVAIILDLDLVKNILIKDFSAFHDRATYYNEEDDPVSAHLFALEGQKWKRLRSKLSPTFTSGKMKFMFPKVVEIANRFLHTISEEIKHKSDIDMKEYLARFTTDIIGECAFGIECNSLKDPNAEFRKKGRAIFGKPRHSRMLINFTRQFPNFTRKLHIKALPDEVSEFFMRIVKETVNYREANNIRRNDFMDLLIDLKNNDDGQGLGNLTIEEIAAESFIFFLGGFETSSAVMTFALHELALNQEIQTKARDEINCVMEKYDGQLTYEAMKEMHYIDQIVNETLRKYPAFPSLARVATDDYRIPDSNVTIEKGTIVFIPAYAIHHDPDIYPDPEVWNPDRFSPERVSQRHPMSFLGFGDGPRSCIGLRFGRMQSRIGLINLLKEFRISRCSKTETVHRFANKSPVLTTVGGVYLNVEKI